MPRTPAAMHSLTVNDTYVASALSMDTYTHHEIIDARFAQLQHHEVRLNTSDNIFYHIGRGLSNVESPAQIYIDMGRYHAMAHDYST